MKKIIFLSIIFLIAFSIFSIPGHAWDWQLGDWAKAINITINSTDAISFLETSVPYTATGLTCSSGNCTKEFWCRNQTNSSVNLDVLATDDSSEITVMFNIPFRDYGTDYVITCYYNNTDPPEPPYSEVVTSSGSDIMFNATSYSGRFYDTGGTMDELLLDGREHLKSYGVGGLHVYSSGSGGNSFYFGDNEVGETGDDCSIIFDGNYMDIINCEAGEDNTNQTFYIFPRYFRREIWGDTAFGVFDYVSTMYTDESIMMVVGGSNSTDTSAGDQNFVVTEPVFSWGHTVNTESLTVVYNDTQYADGKSRTRMTSGSGDARNAVTMCAEDGNQDECSADSWLHMNYYPRIDVDQSYQLSREYLRRFESPLIAYQGAEFDDVPGGVPTYFDLTVSPASPQTYGISSIWFNITANDTDGDLDNVWIIHNISGSSQTFIMSNDTVSNFYHQITYSPSAGGYQYIIHLNDSTGNANQTSTLYYTINKATTTINLSINGTQGDVSGIYPYPTNTTGWKTVSGGYLNLTRDGDIVSNPEIIQLGAGTWNYTLNLSHENYTASSIFWMLEINGSISGLVMTVSPGWTIQENQQVSIGCSANAPLSTTIYRDGVIVANPFNSILPFGQYNFTCTISEMGNYSPNSTYHELNVLSGGFGCTDTTTYAFRELVNSSGTLLNLNFSALINSNITKADLSDVWVNDSIVSNTWINGTSLVLNVTDVSSFYVYFGNYIIGYTHSNHSLSANTTTMSTYEEINPYYIFNFINEREGVALVPPNATNYLTLYCSEGSSTFNVNSSYVLVPTFEIIDEVKYTVRYSASEIYYRNLLISAQTENRNLYLVDAEQHQVVQMILKLQDETGDFRNSILRAKKYLEGTLQTITELNFDAENKVIVFLINGDKYQLYVDNGDEERNIGHLLIDPTDLEKTIVIGTINGTNLSFSNVSYSLNISAGVITFTWIDFAGRTDQVELWVWNYTNSSQLLYYANSTNRSRVDMNYDTGDANGSYIVKWLVHHQDYGLDTTGGQIVLQGSYIYPTLFLFTYLITILGGAGSLWTMLFIITPIPMFFSEKYRGLGALALVGTMALFDYWKMIDLPDVVFGVGIVIAVMIEINTRRGKKT